MSSAVKLAIALAAIIFILGPNPSSSNHIKLTPGKVFLLGGGTLDSTSSIYNAIRDSTGKPNPKISVVISAAYSLADGLDAYYVPDSTSKSYEQLFTDYEFVPSVVVLARDNYLEARDPNTTLGQENIALIRDADVIFFNGGDQSRHSRCWLEDDGSDSEIMSILRSRFVAGEVVIAGTSAGAAVQGSPTYGEGTSYGYFKYNADLKPARIGETFVDDRFGNNTERADINGGFMTGFGFLENTLVDTHFDYRGRHIRLAATSKNVGVPFGFGVEEDTAIYIDSTTARVYGNWGVWFMDSTNTVYPVEDHFVATLVRINYLTEGDIMDFTNNGTVISSKELITETAGKVYGSNDIFGPDEAFKCITSLVQLTSVHTIGWSKTKNPQCRIPFYKLFGITKGYKTGDKFTVENIFMDVEWV